MALRLARSLACALLSVLTCVLPALSQPHRIPGKCFLLHRLAAEHDIAALFRTEIQEAAARLRWRGEPLSPDCLYALAITGASWEPAWNRQRLFSLAWGDSRKAASRNRREEEYPLAVSRLNQAYAERRYARVVELASARFSLEEIGSDVHLKEPVGNSFLAMDQPERAFPIFAAPFDPGRALLDVTDANRRFREAAFTAAQRAGLQKEALAFGASLLLDPGTERATVNARALDYLERAGVEINRLLLGTLECPEKLRGLPAYAYAAADLLAMRATPRLLPFLLHLAQSDDVYLRGRAVVGLGILAYQARPGDPPDWARRVVTVPLREYGISVSQRALIAQEIREAARSDRYRLRAAAALALGLTGDEDNLPLLQKLARDRAYLADGTKDEQTLVFPVRMAAAAALARYGVRAEPGGGPLSGRALEMAKRGNQDETNDRRNLRREVASQLILSPVDVATGVQPEDRVKR